jgi:iron(II)-dependent oxidoreductase
MNPDFRLPPAELAALVEDARRHTLALVEDLSDDRWRGPYLPIVNPPLWEVGHVAYFYEAFLLSLLEGRSSRIPDGEALFNSFVIAHQERWDAPLPSRRGMLEYLAGVQHDVLCRLAGPGDPRETYLYLLAVYHEDMHGEAFTYSRQTHGYPAPALASDGGAPSDPPGEAGPLGGDAAIPGGEYRLGGTEGLPFVFDNEKWAHPVQVAPFRIARAPVTHREFARFVEDGGYRRRELWSYEGWRWLGGCGAGHPVYWRARDGAWQRRHFDGWRPLEPHAPVIHVCWYEAEAYCAWAGRRLPSEAEWELAASAEPTPDGRGIRPLKRRYPWGEEPPGPARANLDGARLGCVDVGAYPAGDSAFGCRQMLGNVWEWTASPFYPFPGYLLDHPYREYSAPWFGDRKVLRGGAWATRARLIRNSYRNFFTPERRDVFAGFRTCAP